MRPRDRDSIYGDAFRGRSKAMGIEEVIIAPRSPWPSPFVESLSGSVRRDCLDRVVVLGERHLRRVLTSYFACYHASRCHMSLDGDPPEHPDGQPPTMGKVMALPEVGGLHSVEGDRAPGIGGRLLRSGDVRCAGLGLQAW